MAPNLVFLGVQILPCRHFHKVKISGRLWPNARVYLAEWHPENMATLRIITTNKLTTDSKLESTRTHEGDEVQ
jgi:hypothetical protein